MSTIQPVLPQLPGRRLSDNLKPYWWRSLCVSAVVAMFWTLVVWLVVMLIAMWLDLVWSLPESLRWWISRGSVLVAAAAAGGWIISLLIATDNDRLARQIDRSQGTGGELLTGWQLSSRSVRPAGDLTAGMAAMAAERAGMLAGSFAPSDVFPIRRARRAAAILGGIVAICGLLAAAMPALASTQVQRFLTPALDVPPFTGITIDLDLETNKVLYGQDVTITATASSASIQRMQLVSLTESGIENVLPMLPTRGGETSLGGQQWQAILTRVTEPLQLYARSGPSRSRIHQLDVQLTPKILPPKVRITPPPYTGQGTYQGPIPQQGLSGLADTLVEWEVTSNRPLAEGRLLIRYRDGSNEQISLQRPAEQSSESSDIGPATIGPVVGSMRLSQPGQFELSVIDIDGFESQETVDGTITILPDQRPIVRIVSPRQMSLATPDVTLPVVISAEDDYGITQLSLYRSLNGSPARKLDLPIDRSPRQNVEQNLPLNRYSLQAGDEIQLFARVEDNDPAGAKGAESPVTTIRIVSIQDFQEMMLKRQGAESLQAKYEAARRHFEALAEALREAQAAADEASANPDSQQATDQLHEKLQAAQQAAEQAAAAMEQLSEQAMPIDVDQELAKRLGEQAALAAEMANEIESMTTPDSSNQSPLSDQQRQRLEQLADQASENRQQLQDQAVDPMRTMQKILPLMIDQQRFTQIAVQQRDLAQRLNSLNSGDNSDADTQRRIAELESEQEQWRQALDELLDDIQTHADELPDDPELQSLKQTAEQFVTAVRASDAMSKMASTQQHLIAGDLDRGLEDAATAAEILESFLSQCNAMGEGAGESCQAAFRPGAGGPNLGNSLQQMMDMMGMKPGSSGMRPGMGFGTGAGGGFAQRFAGPENIGMYGSLPTQSSSPAQGQGDSAAGGPAARGSHSDLGTGNADVEVQTSAEAGGQADQAIPRQYRSQVAEYFRRLAEEAQD